MIAVTGASGGIGGRVARALAAGGAPRSLADVLREHPESTAHLQR